MQRNYLDHNRSRSHLKRGIACFLLALLVISVLPLGGLHFSEFPTQDIWSIYKDLIGDLIGAWLFWLIVLMVALLFYMLTWYRETYLKLGLRQALVKAGWSLLLPIMVFSTGLYAVRSYVESEYYKYEWNAAVENQSGRSLGSDKKNRKHKGAHVFGRLDSARLEPLIRNNFEWVTFVPFIGQDDYNSPDISIRSQDPIRRMRSDSSWRHRIEMAHDRGLKVMFKPHIWMSSPSSDKWRSDIFPVDNNSWIIWSNSYRSYILHHAKLAQESKVELFCIGTELSRLAKEKTEFWELLIKEVREIYSGELTYAGNWYGEYEEITFWEHLDYIGVQAYFPVTDHKQPTAEEVAQGWDKHKPKMKEISNRYRKPILFTEIGYKSTADAGIKPWEWDNSPTNYFRTISTETQANCYQGFFDAMWAEEWFAGIHIWQWRANHERAGGANSGGFTPQNKPAQNVIAKGFYSN